MRLLIITQKVDCNDDVLGFFHRWIIEFAKHCEQVTVVALGVGEYDLPKNVRVFSLGKELRKRSDLKNLGQRSVLWEQLCKVSYVLNFYRLIWHERKNYDAVFVHMNPVYVILGGLLWKGWCKRIGLWYTHKNVDMKLRVAEKLSNIIFTASSESFRLESEKVKVVGHGIDTETFKPIVKERSEVFHVITAGRISPIKDYETFVRAIEILVGENIPVQVNIVGSPVAATDEDYLKGLQALVQEKNLERTIHFIGSIPNKDIPSYLGQADLFVNMSRTGSLDKAVLEAMACGVPVITSNEAFDDVFGDNANMLMFSSGDMHGLAKKIKEVISLDTAKKDELTERFRNIILENHNITALVPRILSHYETGQ